MTNRCVQFFLTTILVASCSHATSPSGPSVGLSLGSQWLSIKGFDLSSDPLLPPCTPFGVPAAVGKWVTTAVNLQREGDEWVARSSEPQIGDLELRFREVESYGQLTVALAGTIRGGAIDVGQFLSPNGARVVFAGSPTSQIEGSGGRSSAFANGRAQGFIQFNDGAGATGTCSAVSWTLQPTSGL